MIQPDESPPPLEPISLPPARRRRARRAITPRTANERTALASSLARRAYPSIEFFLFSLLCGAVLGLGLLTDSQGLLLLGILLAPMMTPWVGLTLAAATGSWRFFIQTLAGLLTGGLLIFATGILSGLAARPWLPLPMLQVTIHTRLWWLNLFITALGAVLLVISFARSEEKPILPSVLIAYALYLPISAAGIGLGSGVAGFFPDGVLVALINLALATLLGAGTLAILKFRPASPTGYVLTISVILLCLAALIALTGLADAFSSRLADTSNQPATALPLPSVTPTRNLPTATFTPIRPTNTPVIVLEGSATPSPIPAISPTPFFVIYAPAYNGARLRTTPGIGTEIAGLPNNTHVQVLPEVEYYNGTPWVHVQVTLPDGRVVEGWVLQSVLATPTPIPN